MKSKEIIQRIVRHDNPPRFGFDFKDNTDLKFVSTRRCVNEPENPYNEWGNYPELKALTGFSGEVRRDVFGNIYGRFEGKTKGECIRGAIQDWEDYEFFRPVYDLSYREELLRQELDRQDKYIMTGGSALFSVLRDARLMENALMDTITDPDAVKEFINEIADREVEVIHSIAGCGVDGWLLGDDWGTQDRTFVSPACFRELFKDGYRKIADACHESGIALFMHSCGHNYGLMEDFIDMGVDMFQFDQLDTYPTEVAVRDFAGRVGFYSPVDVQKVLPTGDREFIETRAREMCELFRGARGSWIAKDYPSYGDIGVEPEWAKWAEDVIVSNSAL